MHNLEDFTWRSWVLVSWYNYENNQQDALYRLIYCSKSARHASGDVFAHYQEYMTIFTVSGSVHSSCCWLMSLRDPRQINGNQFSISPVRAVNSLPRKRQYCIYWLLWMDVRFLKKKERERERENACVNGTDYHQMALLPLHGWNKNNDQTFIITSSQWQSTEKQKRITIVHSSHEDIPYGNNSE